MTSWHSYPKLYAMGHRAIAEILHDDVIVQEKVDGSQFSFGMMPVENHPGTANVYELKIRSKGAVMHVDAPEKMFNHAVATVKTLAEAGKLTPGWTYRGEYLAKPKHNTLAYDRHPKGHIALFDINPREEEYFLPANVALIAEELGLEAVPTIYIGKIETVDQFRAMLDRVSFLGGQKIEGVVVKNYTRYGVDKKVLMGKFVSEAFKEIHQGEWRAANPTKSDVVQALIQTLRTPARWAKAVQHLKEAGRLEGSPRDIGALIKETQADIKAECGEQIADALVAWAMPQIMRGSIGGLPEWYKQELLSQQFETVDVAAEFGVAP